MKKGFTIIEIIISIGLILVIGTISIVSFNIVKNKNKVSALDEMSDEILTALRVFIETNDELKSNVYDNKEGLAVTLKTLENNGLIDFSNVGIKDEDYVVALLSQESDCTDITTLNSWDLTGGTLNICLKGSNNNSNIKQDLISSGSYIAKGENPNNWVYFPVASNPDEVTYFPNDSEQNLWRILSINDQGNIKLVYNKVVKLNNVKKYGFEFNSNIYTFNNIKYYNKKNTSHYYELSSFDNWMGSSIIIDTGDKELLYNNIENKNMIKRSDYACKYHSSISGYEISDVCSLKLGTINVRELDDSYLQDASYLPKNTALGVLMSDETYTVVYGAHINVSTPYYCGSNSTDKYGVTKTYCSFTGSPYLPAVILKNDVELVNNTNSCSGKLGSKECPYFLQCINCN